MAKPRRKKERKNGGTIVQPAAFVTIEGSYARATPLGTCLEVIRCGTPETAARDDEFDLEGINLWGRRLRLSSRIAVFLVTAMLRIQSLGL